MLLSKVRHSFVSAADINNRLLGIDYANDILAKKRHCIIPLATTDAKFDH